MSEYLKTKKKVIFLLPSLEIGGAEKVCVNHINFSKNIEPVLVLQSFKGPLIKEIQKDINIIDINNIKTLSNAKGKKPCIFNLLRTLFVSRNRDCKSIKKIISYFITAYQKVLKLFSLIINWLFHPVTFLGSLISQARKLILIAEDQSSNSINSYITLMNIIALIAKKISPKKYFVTINVHDTTSEFLKIFYRNILKSTSMKLMVRLLYPQADRIIAINEGVKNDLINNFNVSPKKIRVIYNPIDYQKIIMLSKTKVGEIPELFTNESDYFKVISVGRLSYVKGFEYLIEAISLIQEINVKLVIIGEGSYRPNLEEIIRNFEISNMVHLHGYSENPWQYMTKSDIFVLPSLSEGSPNVIIEAMILGIPIVATACSEGVIELLNNGENGMLVKPKDVNMLKTSVERLHSDPCLRNRYIKNAKQFCERFRPEIIIPQFEACLLENDS